MRPGVALLVDLLVVRYPDGSRVRVRGRYWRHVVEDDLALTLQHVELPGELVVKSCRVRPGETCPHGYYTEAAYV